LVEKVLQNVHLEDQVGDVKKDCDRSLNTDCENGSWMERVQVVSTGGLQYQWLEVGN
jgi:hypothetical protein